MGCGSSKNDVTSKSFIRKNSRAGSKRLDQAATNVARSSVNRLEKPAVKDIVENSELKDRNVIDNRSPLDDADTEKQITREHSERYFSSRKDESVDSVVGEGSEYFSPSPGPVLQDGKTNADGGRRSTLGYVNDSSKTNEWMPRDAYDKKVEELPKEGGAPILATDGDFSLGTSQNRELKEKEDLKETILVEITEVEAAAKKKHQCRPANVSLDEN